MIAWATHTAAIAASSRHAMIRNSLATPFLSSHRFFFFVFEVSGVAARARWQSPGSLGLSLSRCQVHRSPLAPFLFSVSCGPPCKPPPPPSIWYAYAKTRCLKRQQVEPPRRLMRLTGHEKRAWTRRCPALEDVEIRNVRGLRGGKTFSFKCRIAAVTGRGGGFRVGSVGSMEQSRRRLNGALPHWA